MLDGDRFTFFGTTFSKSRKNFLELLRAGYRDYVVNAGALACMRARNLTGEVVQKLDEHGQRVFADEFTWSAHPDELGVSKLDVHPDPMKIATEASLFGCIRAHGFLRDAVIILDGAGQFRLADHTLCWIHAERLVQKLIGFNDQQRQALDVTRQLICWFCHDLKVCKRDPCRRRATQMRARFDRLFTRKTGFVTLDRLLARLHARKDELLPILDRPEIPLHTNGSENDIRCQVTKRKISGGTWSDQGRQARDTFLGLLKTCQKPSVSFFEYLGDRLGVVGAPTVQLLALIVGPA
ncbi:MAG: transposase [Alphaproteobacteria bacterium]